MNDSINAKFMHAAMLRDPLGMLPLFARGMDQQVRFA
jgi:hypothetical protein